MNGQQTHFPETPCNNPFIHYTETTVFVYFLKYIFHILLDSRIGQNSFTTLLIIIVTNLMNIIILLC